MATPRWLDTAAYPFTPDRFVELDWGRMHYLDEGPRDAPVLLFVHGTPTWSFEWRHLIRALSDRYRCVAPDLLGFGLSERPRKVEGGFDYTPEAHARAVRQFVERLELRDLTLAVHDFGGPIALPLALDGDLVRRLVVLNSWMWPFDDDPVMAKRARMASGGLGRFLYRRLYASLRLIAPSAWGDRRKLTGKIQSQYLAPFRGDPDAREQVLWTLARSLLGSSAHYRSLWDRRASLSRMPTLIVWGLRDSAFPPRMLERWREALPHAGVVTLEGAGHWPHEEEPEAVVRALEAFLRDQPGTFASSPSAESSSSAGEPVTLR